ncbi:hypothetical protein C4G41_RS22480 [Vibrio parahaemolyticus]|nr:hypothetical protein [Vibrio parahaemolyticus]EJG0023459.1 hypothetical protein [Vibrio parahaemolyticus]EJG0048293.1 hypothetical protein [Vibrio parahaemolyticus]EJG0568719.1 hypothetical protein [Vibrio parahaemolyticus]EJG0725862.1 hypothetical protein [Vibrio parahaemolyticus]
MKYKIIDSYCSELQKVYSSTKIALKEDDDFSFFLVCYLYKINQHMDSIRKLSPSPDVQLVARTMIETIIQMLWVAQNPNERSAMWRKYVFIEDWNTLQNLLKRGESISPANHLAIERAYQATKSDYLTKNQKSVHRDWKKGTKIHQMADDVKAGELYSVLYSGFSDWVHGGPCSIAHQVEFTDRLELVLGNEVPHFVNASLSAAFQSMYQALQICTQHFSLALDEQLKSIYDLYIKELSVEQYA